MPDSTTHAFTSVESATFVLPIDDIDTDQIIPARFLTTTERAGLGDALFCDLRNSGGAAARLDALRGKTEVLVAGENFGCGSSREHAAWALRDYGFRAVLSPSFADIFASNAWKNGVLTVPIPRDLHDWLLRNPGTSVRVDLASKILTTALRDVKFEADAFARFCMLRGIDPLRFLQQHEDAIRAFEADTGRVCASTRPPRQ